MKKKGPSKNLPLSSKLQEKWNESKSLFTAIWKVASSQTRVKMVSLTRDLMIQRMAGEEGVTDQEASKEELEGFVSALCPELSHRALDLMTVDGDAVPKVIDARCGDIENSLAFDKRVIRDYYIASLRNRTEVTSPAAVDTAVSRRREILHTFYIDLLFIFERYKNWAKEWKGEVLLGNAAAAAVTDSKDTASRSVGQLPVDAKIAKERKKLLPASLPTSPFAQYVLWYDAALRCHCCPPSTSGQPVCLSYVKEGSIISRITRIVNVRSDESSGFELDAGSWSNSGSKSGIKEVSLCVFWEELGREVRVHGFQEIFKEGSLVKADWIVFVEHHGGKEGETRSVRYEYAFDSAISKSVWHIVADRERE